MKPTLIITVLDYQIKYPQSLLHSLWGTWWVGELVLADLSYGIRLRWCNVQGRWSRFLCKTNINTDEFVYTFSSSNMLKYIFWLCTKKVIFNNSVVRQKRFDSTLPNGSLLRSWVILPSAVEIVVLQTMLQQRIFRLRWNTFVRVLALYRNIYKTFFIHILSLT